MSPIPIPAKQPKAKATNTPEGKPMTLMMKNATNSIAPALTKVQLRSAAAGSMFSKVSIARMPMIDAISPTMATMIGSAIYSNFMAAMPAPIAIVAIIEPTYDSKISAPNPAVSPTQSPTLSAMTPGFLGSSSGMPASTLPTRSEPTSAVFV